MSYKVCLTLSILCASASANFYYDRFKTLSHHGNDQPFQKSWTIVDHDDPYDLASSVNRPTYSRLYQLDGEDTAKISDSLENMKLKKFLLTASTKKIPWEDKNFKKVVSSFYPKKDIGKYKDAVLKSGAPYCEEVKSKLGSSDSSEKSTMTCYKCKNPNDGAVYEECSYSSQPAKSASTKIEGLIAAPYSLRSRRSNSEEGPSSLKGSHNYRKLENPYRFSEKIFSDTSGDISADYKNKDEHCEKVVKDSMICMLCKDSKTNGKYEQCSYVRQPNEKSYSYSKSSSFKNPEQKKEEEDEESKEELDRENSNLKPVRESRLYGGESREKVKKETDEQIAEDASVDCKKVEKDSKTCTICKDPKTGGNYEKCSYTYEPNDKVYKFSRSKNFGYPRISSDETKDSNYKQKSSDKSSSYPEDYKADYSIPESFYDRKTEPSLFHDEVKSASSYHQSPSQNSKSRSYGDDGGASSEYVKSESEKAAEKIDSNNCKKVEKDSMTCNVCKDPKTGSTSEKCSYNYQPKDKLYSYSKSKSFGSPTKKEDQSSEDKSEKLEKPRVSFFDKEKDFGFVTDKRPYDTASDTKREFREFPTPSETKSIVKEEREERPNPAVTKVDMNFQDAFTKKAEIEKFLEDFQAEDRSKCKKIMRDKMTCYQCVDEKGFQKEECAFATTNQPEKDKITYREVKEFQTDPIKKLPRSTETKKLEKRIDVLPLEPDASSSEKHHVKREKPVKEEAEEVAQEEKESKEVEAYDYTAETRPVFDKVLGLSLPSYMLVRSEHEAEFDEVVASSRI